MAGLFLGDRKGAGRKIMKEKIEQFASEQLEGEVAAGVDHFKRDYRVQKVSRTGKSEI